MTIDIDFNFIMMLSVSSAKIDCIALHGCFLWLMCCKYESEVLWSQYNIQIWPQTERNINNWRACCLLAASPLTSRLHFDLWMWHSAEPRLAGPCPSTCSHSQHRSRIFSQENRKTSSTDPLEYATSLLCSGDTCITTSPSHPPYIGFYIHTHSFQACTHTSGQGVN